MSQLIGAGSLTATLEGASADGSSDSSSGTPDVWYRVTAASAGTLSFDTCGSFDMSGTDTLLSLHSAVPGTIANQIVENDDAPFFEGFPAAGPNATACDPDGLNSLDSALEVNMTAGQTVYLRVTNFAGVATEFVLNTTGPGATAVSLLVRSAFDQASVRYDARFNDYFFVRLTTL